MSIEYDDKWIEEMWEKSKNEDKKEENDFVYCCDCRKYYFNKCRKGDWITGGCEEGIKG